MGLRNIESRVKMINVVMKYERITGKGVAVLIELSYKTLKADNKLNEFHNSNRQPAWN